MGWLVLPHSTTVNRVIPKNAFNQYATAKEKRLFTEKVLRIQWLHKLSEDTINLKGSNLDEIQIFKIELKHKDIISRLLEVIDKAIPYQIIFQVQYGELAYISTSLKHPHPIDNDNAVIDWTFTSDWLKVSEIPYCLNLKTSLDAVYKDICLQISGKSQWHKQPLSQTIQQLQEIKSLEQQIVRLQSRVKKAKQFNKKVELNLLLKATQKKLEEIKSIGM